MECTDLCGYRRNKVNRDRDVRVEPIEICNS